MARRSVDCIRYQDNPVKHCAMTWRVIVYETKCIAKITTENKNMKQQNFTDVWITNQSYRYKHV